MSGITYGDSYYRKVSRDVQEGDAVIFWHEDDRYVGKVAHVYYDKSISADVGDSLPYYPYLFIGDYDVLEQIEETEDRPKKYHCAWCSTELGETACSNSKGGGYCSVQCADADEDVTPLPTEPPLDNKKIIDTIAALSQKLVELERKLDGLGDANERAYKRVADRVEESASNIVTLSQELATKTKEIDDKVEMALGDIVTLDERTQPTQLSKALAALDRMERRGR